jgi:hypothetical protein
MFGMLMGSMFLLPVFAQESLHYTATLSGIAVAQGQTDPRPDFHERELALIIASAGHDCPQIESVSSPENNEPGWNVLRPEVVVCRNGNRFMIVTSGRRNALPIVRPLPPIGERL